MNFFRLKTSNQNIIIVYHKIKTVEHSIKQLISKEKVLRRIV